MIAQRSYDCLVMGAGPAGCCAAALVAEGGYSTLLVERDKMPRFHVGESLMPETYWALERLGILDDMQRLGFTRKHAIQFVAPDGRETLAIVFSDFDDHPSAMTWHVERARFDQLLFDTAYNRGATVADETRVLDIEFKKSPPHKVLLKLANGKEQEVSARVVIDATGQQSLIAHRLGLRTHCPELKKAAIWTYFLGARRNGGANPEATCVLHARGQECWFWYIPLSDGTVSVGLVGDHDYVLKRGGSPEMRFREEMKNCPGLLQRTQDAKVASRFHVAKEFSYVTKQQAGDGWVLVGDAAGFIDPIFCSGVFLALKSAMMAAEAVIHGLGFGNLSARVLGSWTDAYQRGAAPIRKLVRAFYTKSFNLGDFIETFPHHRENLVRILAGKTFEGNASKIFDDLDPWLEKLEQKSQPAAVKRPVAQVVD